MRKYDEKVLDVVYVCDENFSGITGISIYSLLKHNFSFKEINVYVIDNGITEISQKRIMEMVKRYNRNIKFIPAIDLKEKAKFPETLEKNMSVYNNLFLSSMFDLERILYLDGDLIVLENLREFWRLELDGYYLAAVQDTCAIIERQEANIGVDEEYYNSGVLLFNLSYCRENNIESKFLECIKNGPSKTIFRSQRVINDVCKGKVLKVNPRYNLLPQFIDFDVNDLKVFAQTDNFYTAEELEEAKEKPVIVHFAGIERPWNFKKCYHKYSGAFQDIAKETCWGDIKVKSNFKKNAIIDRYLHHFLPHRLYMFIKYWNRRIKTEHFYRKVKEVK